MLVRGRFSGAEGGLGGGKGGGWRGAGMVLGLNRGGFG